MNNLIIILLLFSISNKVIAGDKKDFPLSNTALHIESDNLIINRLKNRVEYIGKVTVHFKDIILTTQKLEVIYNNKTIDHINIPNKLTVKRELTHELLVANSAKYYWGNKQLIFSGNVILQQENNILKTNKLIYYVDLKNG